MKIETKLNKFIKKYFKESFYEGFSIWIDNKTNIWYLITFDINKNVVILRKSDAKDNLSKIKELFPGYVYDEVKLNMYDHIEFFPGSLNSIDILFINNKENGLHIGGMSGIYKFY